MKNKNLKNAVFFTFFFLILILASACKEEPSTRYFKAMDTFMILKAYGNKAETVLAISENEIKKLEETISVTLDGSDIYEINNSPEKEIFVQKDTLEILNFAKSIFEETDGSLNPALYPVVHEWGFTSGEYKIPSQEKINSLLKNTDFLKIQIDEVACSVKIPDGMKIDLGALGKGFAGDKAAEILRKKGIKSALLDLGGNIQAVGSKPDGSEWKVGVRNPEGGDACARICIKDCAVITSGGYERFFVSEDGKTYIHIFDPKTGRPVENDFESVTIISKSGLYADSLSTALFVAGLEKATEFWRKKQNFDFIIITKGKKIFCTAGIKEKTDFSQEFEVSFVEK